MSKNNFEERGELQNSLFITLVFCLDFLEWDNYFSPVIQPIRADYTKLKDNNRIPIGDIHFIGFFKESHIYK